MITATVVQEEVHPMNPGRNVIYIGAAPQTTIAAVSMLKGNLRNFR